MTDKTPYTQAEQEEFRPLLQAKLTEAEADLKLLVDALDADRDTSEPGGQTEGETRTSLEEIKQLRTRQQKYIDLLKEAMARIDNGIYGMCRVTGTRIPKERLRKVPQAVLSLAAQPIRST